MTAHSKQIQAFLKHNITNPSQMFEMLSSGAHVGYAGSNLARNLSYSRSASCNSRYVVFLFNKRPKNKSSEDVALPIINTISYRHLGALAARAITSDHNRWRESIIAVEGLFTGVRVSLSQCLCVLREGR